MVQMFEFDPSDYADHYAAHGFAHIRGALSEEFHGLLCRQVESHLQQSRLEKFALGGKQQSLYEFPEDGDCFGQCLDAIAGVTGLNRARLRLSERHIKAYEADAEAYPDAHKDRFASEVSVGFAVRVPEASRLVLYPYQELDINPFNSWAELREGLPAARRSQVVLASAERVELADRPRDLVLFRGNAIWHMRENPAGAIMVYLKLNTFNSDPLGEDPRTPVLDKTGELLKRPDGELRELIPQLSRRVDYIGRRYNHVWQEVIGVTLWGQPFQVIDIRTLKLLRAMDGLRSVSSIADDLLDDGDLADSLRRIRDLALRGIIELCVPEPLGTPPTAAAVLQSAHLS